MTVTAKPATNDKFKIGKARMQKLLQNGTFSKVPNPMTKFPKLVLTRATKKASTIGASRTPTVSNASSVTHAVASKTHTTPTKKVTHVTPSKAAVAESKASGKRG